MRKVLIICTVPDELHSKPIQVNAQTIVEHPQLRDIEGKLIGVVRIDAVVLLPEPPLTCINTETVPGICSITWDMTKADMAGRL